MTKPVGYGKVRKPKYGSLEDGPVKIDHRTKAVIAMRKRLALRNIEHLQELIYAGNWPKVERAITQLENDISGLKLAVAREYGRLVRELREGKPSDDQPK